MAELENKNQQPEGTSVAWEQTHSHDTASQAWAQQSSQAPATPQQAAVTPTSTVQIQAPIIKKSPNKGKRLSPITLAIGCVLFFVLFIGFIMAAWLAVLENPRSLWWLMSPAQAKSLLMIVWWAFFGILFLVSFAFLWLNAYRLSKAKNTPKLKFIVGIFVSFLLVTISIWVGAVVLSRIQKIDAEIVYSKDLLIARVSVATEKDDKPRLEEIAKSGIATVAPIEVFFSASKNLIPVLRTKLWVNVPETYKISCGNATENNKQWQIVDATVGVQDDTSSNQTIIFPKPCFYTKKGEYKVTLLYTYFDKARQVKKDDTLEVATVKIGAEIILKNDGIVLKTNDDKDELLAWDSPARIVFDAKKVFSDLGLVENEIIWNIDWIADDPQKENKTFFSHNFNEGKLYRIYYRLPGTAFPTYYYSFPLRTLQSDVPICTIVSDRNDNGSYTFRAEWPNGGSDIENLKFEVYNLNQERIVQTSPTQNWVFTYSFTDNQQYQINLLYNTLDKKKWICSSSIINEASEAYSVKASLKWQAPNTNWFKSFTASGDMTLSNNVIISNLAPFDLQVTLDSISPALPRGTSINVELDGKKLDATKANVFSTRVFGPKEQTLKLFIDDKKWNTVEKTWTISFDIPSLIGELKADKVTGNDPFNVQFDASTITATEDGDEIIYYTWDFGDGDIKKNITQSNLTHLYSFNTATQEWIYNPKVTVQTKKWFSKTFTLATPISVTRRTTQAMISSTSHPTQLASTKDTVSFTVQADGYVTAIAWDFGDGTRAEECESRACSQVSHKFTTPWTYTVKATVQFKWLPSATNTLKIKVE